MRLDTIRRRYERLLEWLVIVLMGVLAVEVTVGVVYRTLGASLVWYDEVASILLAWITFYGSALASVKRAHIGCPEVMMFLPPKAKLAFRVAAEVLTIGFFVLLGWTGYMVLGALSSDTLVSLPEVPVSWVQSVMPISAALVVAAELTTLPATLAKAARSTSLAEVMKAAAESAQPPSISGGASH
ncbi:MAG TPA: TRAP transporter small permease subunit [Burkholderiales bacterium]|nr:TRAP transporter small permease subunit [Burkholderiales bacterium]